MMDSSAVAPPVAATSLRDPDDLAEGSLSSTSSSGSSSDLAPRMQAQFNNLSSVLAETNENLLSFEFMLQQYRQQARIRPMGTADQQLPVTRKETEAGEDVVVLSETQMEMNSKLERLLSDLSDAVGKVATLKEDAQQPSPRSSASSEALRKEATRLREALTAEEAKVEDLKRQNKLLEQDGRAKAEKCERLAESAHRARAELAEERGRREKLDEKLEREQRAARKVGQDITRYVEQMRALEEEVAKLKREARAKRAPAPASAVVDMQGDVLTATLVPQKGGEEENLASRLEEERCRTRELQSRVARYEEQEAEYERQLAELKSGLVSLQRELEEKCQALPPIGDFLTATTTTTQLPQERLLQESGGHLKSDLENAKSELEATREELSSLKLKSKNLVRQYRRKRSHLAEQSARIASARHLLEAVMAGCAESERNYRTVLCHLGSEVEVSVRLLCAYLGVELLHREPVRMSGRPLEEWFADVRALSRWLQAQLVAFGKRFWTSRESVREVLPPPTIPARSMEDEEEDGGVEEEEQRMRRRNERSVRDAIRAQEKIRGERWRSFDELTKSLAK